MATKPNGAKATCRQTATLLRECYEFVTVAVGSALKTIMRKTGRLLVMTMVAAMSLSSGVFASDDRLGQVPSPTCIQTILDQDIAVPAATCLADATTVADEGGTGFDGAPYPVAALETDRYHMRIHYTGGGFPDAVMANWPLSIDLNTGGSGWFSYLLVLVETQNGDIALGFVQPAGDRCNDGYARWERFSENGNGIYRRAATPFRLVNPLDETNWRAVENALMFDGKDESAQKAEMLSIANPPLHQDWLPYRELDNCAACCAGEIVMMQSMIGTEIDPGRDYGVLGVTVNRQVMDELQTSDKIGDRCLATAVQAAADRADPDRSTASALFFYRESWLEIRNGLTANCPD